ncbi:fatty acid hydroxylase family protein [Dyella solisilvae]|uniref:Fatty acid hydroxylase family protein n=1 Tax=Dyella solisilvae TaxID=1920168 RepID=A0A370KCG9_9GAMM|nr:sterol desaturase family protein [Dyella solisilvae]RDI99800.1 fatty acid hydroxylase family protein [Dyella solisilvae]
MLALADPWSQLLNWTTLHLVEPALLALHLQWLHSQAPDIGRYFVLTAIQVVIIAMVLRPLENVWPAEPWEQRRTTAIDCRYTMIKLFLVLPLFTYLVLFPLNQWMGGDSHGDGVGLVSIQQGVPWLGRHPVVLFLMYYAIYDFVYYVVHRLQHSIPWWWALHSLHHSQRQLSCWSNDRDHYLDDMLEALIIAAVGVVIGVAPTEFALLVLLGELLQNLGHANIRLTFGPVLGRVLVDPRYHRLHHMRVDPDRPTLHACNYAFIFPIWDILFGTALYGEATRPTGVCDPTVDADNRHGILAQQWMTLRRCWGAISCRAGWTPGDVAFDERYRPVSTRHIDLHVLEKHGRPWPAAHADTASWNGETAP